MKITGAHVAAARELLKISQGELAKISGVGRATLARFESAVTEPHPSNLDKVQFELERRGIEFTNGDGIGVRLNYAKAAEFARTAAKGESASNR